MNDVEQLVQSRLRSLRHALGWSHDELGDKANLSSSTISGIETGKRSVSLDVLLPLARALQVDVESLLDSGESGTDVGHPARAVSLRGWAWCARADSRCRRAG